MTTTTTHDADARARWNATEVAVAIAAVALASVAMVTQARRPESALRTAAAATLFALVVGGYFAFGVAGVRHSLRHVSRPLPQAGRLLAGPAVLLIAVVLYADASGLIVGARLATYGPYLLAPPLLLATRTNDDDGLGCARVAEFLMALALWLPIECGLLASLPVPAPNGYDFRKLVGLVDGMYLFLVARPLPRIGYTYRLTRGDVAAAVVAFSPMPVYHCPLGSRRPSLPGTRSRARHDSSERQY